LLLPYVQNASGTLREVLGRVLGEVATPGQFPYVPNLTAEGAVAIAGGFSPRALRGPVEMHRQGNDGILVASVPLNYPVRPGDTIVVAERWF